MDEQLKKVARDFRKSMQELVDNPDGSCTSISVSTNGKDYIPIATKNNKKMKTEKIQCDCILTDDEKLVLSKELSEHISKKKRAEDDLVAFNAQKKAEVKGHDAHINRIAELLNNGREFRTVLCEVQLLDKNNKAVWIRSDTGEIAKELSPIPEYLLQ